MLLYLKEFVSLNCDYSLYVGCSEENTMDDAAYMIAHVPMPEVSLVADCGFPVCHGEKGNLSLVFETCLLYTSIGAGPWKVSGF